MHPESILGGSRGWLSFPLPLRGVILPQQLGAVEGRGEPVARGRLQAMLQLTLAAPVMGKTQCSAAGGGRTM